MIYGADGHPATYKDLSVSAFARGYLRVLKSEQDSQLKELAHGVAPGVFDEDVDVYGWV